MKSVRWMLKRDGWQLVATCSGGATADRQPEIPTRHPSTTQTHVQLSLQTLPVKDLCSCFNAGGPTCWWAHMMNKLSVPTEADAVRTGKAGLGLGKRGVAVIEAWHRKNENKDPTNKLFGNLTALKSSSLTRSPRHSANSHPRLDPN